MFKQILFYIWVYVIQSPSSPVFRYLNTPVAFLIPVKVFKIIGSHFITWLHMIFTRLINIRHVGEHIVFFGNVSTSDFVPRFMRHLRVRVPCSL